MPALFNPHSAAVRGLNALLSREQWARDRLRPHAGKTARLVLGASHLLLRITAAGQVEDAAVADDDAAIVPDVTLTIATDKLTNLLSNDTARRMSAVRIDGDAALAHAIGDLARDLRWDVEDDLARVVGDIPAARLVSAASGAMRGLRDGAWRVAENVAEYLSEEIGAVASSHELDGWAAEVQRLRDDGERAAKRVALLEARLARLEHRAVGGANKE